MKVLPIATWLLFVMWSTAGCSASRRDGSLPPSRFVPEQSALVAAVQSEPVGDLLLTQALALAQQRSPQLAGAGHRVRAYNALAVQEGLWQNPQVEIGVDEFIPQRATQSPTPLQVTAQVRQTVEFSGEPSARRHSAQRASDVASWEYEIRRLAIRHQVHTAFINVLQAQRRVHNASEMVELAQQVLTAFESKVAAGRVSSLEAERAAVALSWTRIEEQRAQSDLAAARYALVALWGGERPLFHRAVGGFDTGLKLPSLDNLLERLGKNPELSRQRAAVEQAEAELMAVRASAIPDVDVFVGYSWLNEPGESAVLGGLSMPVPLFDRRQGSIEAAEHRVRQAQADYRAVRIDLVRRLGQAHQALLTAQQEVHTLQQQSLPAARRAYRAVVEGYRIGRFGYLEQIDAQRSLFTAIQRTVEARSSYFQNLANIEFLVATNLFSWEQQQQQLEKKSEPSSAHPASQPASQPESGSHNGGLTQ